MPLTGEQLTEKFYEIYNNIAAQHNCQVELTQPWNELTEDKKQLMISVFEEVLKFVYASPISMLQPLQIAIDLKNLNKLPRRKPTFHFEDWMIDDDED